MTATTHHFFHTSIRNSTYTTVGYTLNMLMSVVFAGLTIRFLGLSRAGFLMALQALLGVNGVLGDFGLSVPLSRRLAFFVSRHRFHYARRILGTIMTTGSVSSVLIGVLIVATFPWILHYSQLEAEYHGDAWWATLLTAIQFVLLQPSYALRSAYTSCQRYDLFHGTSIIINLASNLVRLGVLLVWPSMAAVALATLLTTTATILFDVLWLRPLLHGVSYPALLWREVRQALGFGAWNWATKVGQFFYGSVDRIILTAYLGAEALPFFALPQRFVSLIHGLLAGQLHYLFPYFSALGRDSTTIIRQVEDRVQWMLALVAVVLYGGVALFGETLLRLMISPEFAAQAMLPLQLACIQGVFMAQVIFNYYVTWSQNEARVNAIYDLTTYAGGAVLALGLIPFLGVTGAALAKLVAVPLFFCHLYHSRLSLKLPCDHRAALSPYLLPLILAGYLALSQWLLSSFIPDWHWRLGASCLVLLLGCGGVWLLEMRCFHELGRGEMVTRLILSAWNWLKCFGARHPI